MAGRLRVFRRLAAAIGLVVLVSGFIATSLERRRMDATARHAANQSDQGPFHDAVVRTLYFRVEDHADDHQPTDTAEKIPPAFDAEVMQLVLSTVRFADAS